ncbi:MULTISPECIES: metal transporter [unclassified Shewanella]|uniref:metal transporter n=1 Tax=unclassified Shewanella TaxID=196818 RepID=UPI0015689D55|nr:MULTISPECIES: metal transporter [unclassified Shewanella]MBW3516940.1 ZIP family metal transporter [Shewanella sp. NKUCC01_JLK]MCU8004062.1 ZIP family metal transporter [Shewanella sp. SM96]MCU8055815.1 ZIP family metal transporter [Shewanella sp. SM35]MCU8062232.1 ZIP family metal transporter [Shewanella sp. SM55]MCU8064607.1 ZIP family metal transporter [Shewanella sp. SM34]
MLYLLASCIALLIGPLFYRYFSSSSGLQKGLDGFIFVSLGGLVLIHILPELLEHGGMLAIVFVLLGIWGPTASERLFHRYSEVTHNFTLFLGIGGLLLHTITDGTAMVLAQQDDNSILLALGVILHQLPVGFAVWWILKPHLGTRWTLMIFAAQMLFTGIGYFAGEQLLPYLNIDDTVYLQAFITGTILHVVLHQPHGQHESDTQGKYEYQAGIGSLLGIGLLVMLLLMDSGGHEHAHHDHSTEQLITWLLKLAPVLLLSYGAAALRFKLGLTPQDSSLARRWFQRLAGPEALVITALLLGPWLALFQLLVVFILSAYLSHANVTITDPHTKLPSNSLRFGFAHLVDRSAPWILLSLVLVNLIGHPSMPLSNPLLQVVVLLLVFLPMRFCNLGAAVLALALAYSGWSPIAIMMPLIAAPVLNIAQLKLMTWTQRAILLSIIALSLAAALRLPLWFSLFTLPEVVNLIALLILSGVFAASLLRLGPRKFLRRLMLSKPAVHAHSHAHSHSHENTHTHESSASHTDEQKPVVTPSADKHAHEHTKTDKHSHH